MTHAALDRSERKFAQKRGTPLPEHIVSLFDDDFLQAPEHAALLSRVSLVVAMHADGATEAAVQWAHRRQLPVVAVPCCVFPSRFPGRRLRDGESRAGFKYLRWASEPRTSLRMSAMAWRTALLSAEGRETAVRHTASQVAAASWTAWSAGWP